MPLLSNSLSLKRFRFTLSLAPKILILILGIIFILDNKEILVSVYIKVLYLDNNSGLPPLIIITSRYLIGQFYKKTIKLLNIILFFKSYTPSLVLN
jgi:hypothetical protein